MYRVALALTTQNRESKPSGRELFKRAYVIGRHIWLMEHCAEEWKREMRPKEPIEVVTYQEAYEYAKSVKLV